MEPRLVRQGVRRLARRSDEALRALDELGPTAPTADLPHPIEGLLSIDHIAVPKGTRASASRIAAERDVKRLSGHDAYVVEVS